MDLEEGPKAARAGRRAGRAFQDAQDSNPFPAASTDDRSSAQQGTAQAGPASPAPPTPDEAAADSRPPVSRQGFGETQVAAATPAAAAGPAAPADLVGDPGKKFTGVSRRKAEQELQEKEQAAKAKSKYDDRAVHAELLEIPELEEEGKEDLSRVVAAAPKMRTNKVQGIDELEEDAQYRLPASDDRDIDLSILTAVLCPSDQVYEPDEVWDPDILFANVASDINAEKEKALGLDKRDSFSNNALHGI